MDVMNSPAKSTSRAGFSLFLKQIRSDYPRIGFKPADTFRWSDENKTIYYDRKADDPVWSLLHELGHMVRGHSVYSTDIALIRLELEAWQSAKELGDKYGHSIDPDHIEDCMDSYRAWQHKRSACPTCRQTGVEKLNGQYLCINCRAKWQVSDNRFCRVYRRSSQPSAND